MSSTSPLRISRRDVAKLARVRHPVVTVWRSRYTDSATPFPEPVDQRGTQQLFDGDQIVTWLEATGRGNNRDARADLAAYASFGMADLNDGHYAGLTTLLCLAADVDRLPPDAGELLDLADAADPDDTHLYGELVALGDDLVPLARYASQLIDAAYHAGAAFESLMDRWRQRPRSGHARTALAPAAQRLVADLALAIGTQFGSSAPVYIDPTGGSSDLIKELSVRAAEDDPPMVLTPNSDTADGRLGLRRLRVHGIVRKPLPDDDGAPSVPDHGVVLMQVPAPDRPEMSDLEMLQSVGDLVDASRQSVRMVVIGPSSALTDRVRGKAANIRDEVLRSRRVRGIVRLPVGLHPTKPRARLAVWCIGPDPTDPADPDGPWTVEGDLADRALDDTVIGELVTDLMAGMQDVRTLALHAPRCTRAIRTFAMQARQGDLVTPVPLRGRARTAAETVERITALTSRLSAPLPGPDAGSVRPSTGPGRVPVTLGDALDRADLRLLPGHHLAPDHLDPDGAVRVIGPPELVLGAGAPRRGIDRLVLAAHHSAAQYTGPGDVVFCTAPRPAALVDTEGGSVVVHPARILRSRSPCLLPRVLAEAINARAPDARTWRSWTVRAVPDAQADALTATLDGLARLRADLAARIVAVDELGSALIDGTASGTLTLTQQD